MKNYVMTGSAEAVLKIVSYSDELENEYRKGFDDLGRLERCNKLLQAIVDIQDSVPFELNELPQMMRGFISAILEMSASGGASKDEIKAKANELIPVVEGFSGICQRGYLDHFTDLPGGGLSKVMIEDHMNRDYEKHALLIYIVSPFMDNIEIKGHTNAQDARSIAEVLDNLGYSVDIINPWYEGEIDHEKYDLVIGFRKAFEDMLPLLRKDCIKIYYLTTMNSYVANMAEAKRVADFYQRNNVRPAYRRLEYSCMDLERVYMCDGAICLGNEHTVSTYKGMFKKILAQNVSGFQVEVSENDNEAGRDFMWYGGAGSLHKGVDLCIEAFRKLPECNLHIVGRLDDDIYEFYKDELETSPNVIYHGFMYHDDEEFIKLCKQCSFSIGVSCSESQSTAMITSVFAGLIPICNDETGIDTLEYGGIRLDSVDPEYLRETLSKVSLMSEEEIQNKRRIGQAKVSEYHTVDAYKKQLAENIKHFI